MLVVMLAIAGIATPAGAAWNSGSAVTGTAVSQPTRALLAAHLAELRGLRNRMSGLITANKTTAIPVPRADVLAIRDALNRYLVGTHTQPPDVHVTEIRRIRDRLSAYLTTHPA